MANSLALLTSASHPRTTCPRALLSVTWGPAFQSQSSGPQAKPRNHGEQWQLSPHYREPQAGLPSARVEVPLEGDISTSPHSGIFMAQCTLTDHWQTKRKRSTTADGLAPIQDTLGGLSLSRWPWLQSPVSPGNKKPKVLHPEYLGGRE